MQTKLLAYGGLAALQIGCGTAEQTSKSIRETLILAYQAPLSPYNLVVYKGTLSRQSLQVLRFQESIIQFKTTSSRSQIFIDDQIVFAGVVLNPNSNLPYGDIEVQLLLLLDQPVDYLNHLTITPK